MTEVVIDPSMRDRLAAAQEPVRIIDADGNLLGTFQPAGSREARDIPPMTLEEMRHHASQPGGRTLREIVADLEASR